MTACLAACLASVFDARVFSPLSNVSWTLFEITFNSSEAKAAEAAEAALRGDNSSISLPLLARHYRDAPLREWFDEPVSTTVGVLAFPSAVRRYAILVHCRPTYERCYLNRCGSSDQSIARLPAPATAAAAPLLEFPCRTISQWLWGPCLSGAA